MAEIRPCVYPGCSDQDGNPRLTTTAICGPSRRHYARQLDDLVLDYVLIATTMPQPIVTDVSGVRAKRGTPGHPRAWASDTLRQIAEILDGAEDSLRDVVGDTPPAPPGTARESRIVARASQYLRTHFDALCTFPGARDVAAEITDTHRHIRSALGMNRIWYRLPTPCPWCESITLVRTLDRNTTDSISCDGCGKSFTEENFQWYARHLLDRIIDEADTPTTVPA